MWHPALSTWSLHRNLGPLRWTKWDEETKTHIVAEQFQPQLMELTELPAAAGQLGYRYLEICHFHFPSLDPTYLQTLKTAFTEAGSVFRTLLLDYGDITSADETRRSADLAFIKQWIDIAAMSGAERIRVIAGEAGPDDLESLQLSLSTYRELLQYGHERGVGVIMENFKPLTSTLSNCLSLLQAFSGDLETIIDFGNMRPVEKYDAIRQMAPYAVSIHAKPQYDENGIPDEAELVHCLEALHASHYAGPISIIYDGPGDMWEGIERVRSIIDRYTA